MDSLKVVPQGCDRFCEQIVDALVPQVELPMMSSQRQDRISNLQRTVEQPLVSHVDVQVIDVHNSSSHGHVIGVPRTSTQTKMCSSPWNGLLTSPHHR